MNLIFDFDGTLHVSHATYMPAFTDTLSWMRAQGCEPARAMSCEEVGYWLGTSSARMWELIAPEAGEELREACAERMRTRILQLAREGRAELYPHIPETLAALVAPEASEELREACAERMRARILQLARAGKAELYPHIPETLAALTALGHTLVLLSNCRHGYLQTFREVFALDAWFSRFYCGEDFGWAPKSEVFATIAADLGCAAAPQESCIVIGDRYHDIGIAREHGLRSVGCAYGYGEPSELEDASIVVEAPEELLAAIESLVG